MSWQTTADYAQVGILLATFNHQPRWMQAQAPHTDLVVKGFRRYFGSEEVEYINSHGAKGAEIICDLATFNGMAPEKFDRFEVDGEIFTVQAVKVIPGHTNSRLIVRCYCHGG